MVFRKTKKPGRPKKEKKEDEEEDEVEEEETEEEETEEEKVPEIEPPKKKVKKKDLIIVNELPTQPIRSFIDEEGEHELMTRDEALKEILEIMRAVKED